MRGEEVSFSLGKSNESVGGNCFSRWGNDPVSIKHQRFHEEKMLFFEGKRIANQGKKTPSREKRTSFFIGENYVFRGKSGYLEWSFMH